MADGKAPMLSQMERAILGSLHDDGPCAVVELVARLRPSWGPRAVRGGARAERGIEASLTYLRHLQVFLAADLVTKNDCGIFAITAAGARLVERHHLRGQSAQVQPWVKVVGSAGVLLHLGSCGSLPQAAPAQVNPPALELAMSYDMQQFRDERGVVAFRACASDCEKPTIKTFAVATKLNPQPPASQVAAAEPIRETPRSEASQLGQRAPAALYRVYFRFGTAEFGPGALQALNAALPDLRTMERIEIAAGADPIGTKDMNRLQIQLRQDAVKDFLVRRGVKSDRVSLVSSISGADGIRAKGMAPRSTKHAEMRRADILAHAGANVHAAK